jgi:hypothetical protein
MEVRPIVRFSREFGMQAETVLVSEIPVSQTVSISSVGKDEFWLQEQIWANPSCLGLGDLEAVSKERVVSGGGRVDTLLKDPVDDAMYEVEVTLGDTDPSHIMRAIEYWDIIKRKWPQRQHFAVLVAEQITKRFFNVIQILSGSVPLIAIQANVVKSGEHYSLHFTKVLDIFEEEDDGGGSGIQANETYWQRKSNETLEIAKHILNNTTKTYKNARLGYTQGSVNIVCEGYNEMVIRPRADGHLLFELRYGKNRDEIARKLEEHEISPNQKGKNFNFILSPQRAKEKLQAFSDIAPLNYRWWVTSGNGT